MELLYFWNFFLDNYKPLMIAKKQHCKGDPYRFSGFQDPLVQSGIQIAIVLLLYKDNYVIE